MGIILLICSLSKIQAQSVLIDVLSGSGNPGNTVQVSVVLESSGGAQPASLQVDLIFSPSVVTFTRTILGPAAEAAGKSLSGSLTTPGNLRLLVSGMNQTVINDGAVAIVEFQIAASASVSSTTLALRGTVASTPGGQSIQSSAGSGLIIVSGGIVDPRHLYFSQIAAGGGYSSSLALVNPGNSPVTALLELFKQDGSPLVFKLNGNLDNAFAVALPAHGVTLLESPSSGNLRAGWARVRSTATIAGSIIYAFATSGNVVSEAGIDPSVPTSSFALSVDTRQGFLSGVALANPNASAVSVQLTLYSGNGVQLGRQTRNLPAMNQLALTVDQIFAGLRTDFTGVMTVRATGGGSDWHDSAVHSQPLGVF